jgi:hydrophobic/amphiphilic exporter-1 (mainly G- bacteria), HAE1 family
MNISHPFIMRPVMTTLVMVAILIFGAIGYVKLPVSELPDIEFPTISVTAVLPGADAETMASAVATPLENQFSTIAGIDTMTSASTLGQTRITMQFKLDRSIDAAAQDVQSAIAATLRRLPPDMPTPPTLRKVNPAAFAIFYLAMSSETQPLQLVNQYAEGQLARRLSTIDGVAQVSVWGSQKFAVRLQMDPDALAARGIGIDEVARAAKSANVNQPTGTLEGETRSAVIRTQGQLLDAESFRRQIVTYRKGAPVRFADIGDVVDGVENNKVASWFNNNRAVVLSIQRQPGSNTIAVVDAIKKALPSFEAQLPPSVTLDVLYDRSDSIREGIHDVQFTLLLAAALVVMVIFIFLRNWTATLIPSLALPIAVVGSFAGMAMFGYSLDNLSLMALTLSVGFVVDDAIVMLENIVRHVEKGEKPFDAALKGSREIGFTILSMTISLAAVFIPVLFMGGIVGRLLHEFAVTIVLAILVSGVVSITLTPMMCARVVRAEHGRRHGAIYRAFERGFELMQSGYDVTLRWSLRHKGFTFLMFLASFGGSIYLFYTVPKDFLPSEDTGRIIAFTEGLNGTSFADMVAHQQRAAKIIMGDPNISRVMSSVGAGGPRATANSGTIFIGLKPREERELSADQVIQKLRPQLARIPGLNVFLQNPPSIRIGGQLSKAQYQYTLQGLDLDELYGSAVRLREGLAGEPGFLDVTSDLDLSTPAVKLDIERERAATLGVTPEQIQSALAAAFGGQQISTIYTASDQYQVILELGPQYQRDARALQRLYVRSATGTLVPLTAVVKVGHSSMPLTVNHSGQLPSVTVSFNLAPNVSLSQAVDRIWQVSTRIGMPASVQTSYQGTAQAFQDSMQGMGLLLLLAVVVVYIVLGILYESFIHPLTILSGLPSAAVGALITLQWFEVPLSLYAFVGIIMLVGIVKKNAIMMIDFALERERGEGMAPAEAIYQAALIRFRPIMMTTMAALMGTLPIALAYGAGAEARQPLGLAVVGGLILSQLLTLYITPVLYILLDRAAAIGRTRQTIPEEAAAAQPGE